MRNFMLERRCAVYNYRSVKRFLFMLQDGKNINRISITVIKYLLFTKRIGGFTKRCKEGSSERRAFREARLTMAR